MSKMISSVVKKNKSNFFLEKDDSFLKTFMKALFVNTLISIIILLITCARCREDGYQALIYFLVSLVYGQGLYLGMSSWNNYLGSRISWLDAPWKSFWIALLSNSILVIIIVYIINLAYQPLLYDCNFRCVFNSLGIGEFIIPLFIGLLITTIFQAANFLAVWKKSLVETEKYKNAQLAAQYQALNSQVNPHFLFNSLNVLSTLVKKDPEKAEKFIYQLSNVYRNVLDVRNEELISIQQELKTLEAYLFLIETRFGKRIQMDIQINPKEDGYLVPLSLQMLVENAVKHNAATLKNPLTIQLYTADGFWWIKNNRKQMSEPVPGKGMGLENIRQRYQMATGKEIIVQDKEDFYAVGLPVIGD